MSKKDGSHLPTVWQAQTLKMMIEGWELLISEWCDEAYRIMCEGKRKAPSRERIYWRKHNPRYKLNPYYSRNDTLECGSPKMKRHSMSHLERYGWVVRSDTGWTITDAGRAAVKRHEDWFNEYEQRRQSEIHRLHHN